MDPAALILPESRLGSVPDNAVKNESNLLLDESQKSRSAAQWFKIHGQIRYRFLINYRMSESLLRRFDLGPLSFDCYQGESFLSVCALRMKLRPEFSPLAFPWCSEFLYRLAVKTPRGERAFISLLSLNSSPVIAKLGVHFAPFRFRYEKMSHSEDGQLILGKEPQVLPCHLRLSSKQHLLEAELSCGSSRTSKSSIFASAKDAQNFLLELDGGVSLRGSRFYRQKIDRTNWDARFFECQFESGYLKPWLSKGLLQYDSTLLMTDLKQTWYPTKLEQI